ncbi:MAG: M23 family metallopeptidase [Cellvibrionales bacterium]|nr:M23 family metallopeptidase [Cellvibrionales bacterium]
MNIILLRGLHSRSRSIRLPNWLLLACCGGMLSVAAAGGFWLGHQPQKHAEYFFYQTALALQADVAAQDAAVQQAKQEAERQLQAVSLRLAQMQAGLSRLEALGELLTTKADLADGEFDFSTAPALGGPDLPGASWPASERQVLAILESLSQTLDNRSLQLGLLAELIQDKHLQRETAPSGLPAARGWLSSRFGMRADPFTGKQAWHNGVDIAAKHGTDVLAVASGVVSFAGERGGYGQLVEITHENGFVTRYGHSSEIYVAAGDIVKKGQVISAMGSTGRSTGSHVHFEVLKHGRAVDPASYIRRTVH